MDGEECMGWRESGKGWRVGGGRVGRRESRVEGE